MRPAARAAVLALSSVLSDPGKIVPVGNTSVPRFSHTATLLRNGKVLIAGGMSRGSTTQPTAELYDPTTRQFTQVGNLTSHVATARQPLCSTTARSSSQAARVVQGVFSLRRSYSIPLPKRSPRRGVCLPGALRLAPSGYKMVTS